VSSNAGDPTPENLAGGPIPRHGAATEPVQWLGARVVSLQESAFPVIAPLGGGYILANTDGAPFGPHIGRDVSGANSVSFLISTPITGLAEQDKTQ
jgi:hypothetical protein